MVNRTRRGRWFVLTLRTTREDKLDSFILECPMETWKTEDLKKNCKKMFKRYNNFVVELKRNIALTS